MNYFKLKTFLWLSSFILFQMSLLVAVPLALPPSSTNQKAQLMAAENAFDMGLFEIAQRLYTELLQKATNSLDQQSLSLQLAFTLINQSKYIEALAALNKLPNQNDPVIQLLTGLATIKSNPEFSQKTFEKITPKELPQKLIPWFYIAQGLLAEYEQNFKEAKSFFLESRALTHSDNLKNHIDILLFNNEINSQKITETLELTLEKKIEKSKKTSFPLIKQYAIVLDKLGRKEKAIELLKTTLASISPKDSEEIDSINFLIAILSTPESPEGRQALEKIIERRQNPELSKTALSLLTQSINKNNANSYMKFLTSNINSTPPSPLIDHLLLHRAHLALFLNQPEIAQRDAIRIQEDYPGSSLIPQTMRLLAYLAWTASPPHYRTAADILAKLSNISKNPSEQSQLMLLAADSYFLNQDYPIAAKIYASTLESSSHELGKGPILSQLVLSLINQNDLKQAEIYLDKFRNDPAVDPTHLWQAEWNLINSMKKNGQIQLAFSQIHKLLQSPPPNKIPLDLKLRLIWLRAQLSLESGNPQDTPPLIDSLLALLQSSQSENIDLEQTNLVASHALLLKAQALFQLNREKEALETISNLRLSYPLSKPTMLSYLTEAHYYTSIHNSNKAQQSLINLADNYPNNEYTAIALYEAALNAESRSLKNTYQEALALLERLISSYPDSPFTYNARFKQAEILRKLGNFSDALLLYENLLKQYPNHPEKYKTKLACIDSLFAQMNNNPTALLEIASQYYTLLDLPTLPPSIRAEGGFKSGFAYIKAGQPLRAQNAFWLTINTLLLDASVNEPLNEQSRYWLSRSIFALGSLLENSKQFKEANEVYQLILSHNLPGTALASSKVK